jgi:hypothetical protein
MGSTFSRLSSRLAAFFARHPLLGDALIWAIPAVVFGLALRLVFLSYSPCAYWGDDSRSYFGFTSGVLNDFYFSINEKRRYLYPVFLLPLSLLPGGTLRILPWVQAAAGVLTILPFAYLVRRIFVAWRWLVIPLTMLLAGLPVFLWHEHELIADTVLFNGIVWAMAGWAAWVNQHDAARARALWWTFLIPLAIILLTKPSSKLYWPGLLIALVMVGAWRTLRWREWLGLGVIFMASLTVGEGKQAAWLLYNTAFPLTRLDTPLHAEYKAGIRDWVKEKRARIDAYSAEDYEVQYFLRGSDPDRNLPLWEKLKENAGMEQRVYRDLALEGIQSRPDLFLYIGLQRLLRSANPGDFKASRFGATYIADNFCDQINRHTVPDKMVRIALGLRKNEPLPDTEQFHAWLAPDPQSAAAKWLVGYVRTYERAGELITRPQGDETPIFNCRPTPLGWLLIVGLCLSFLPPYLRTLGVWNIATAGYLAAVYLIGIQQIRYIAPAWPLFILCLGVAIDAMTRLVKALTTARRTPGSIPENQLP